MNKTIPSLLAVGLLIIPATFVQAKVVRMVERSFAVESGGTLKVKTKGGDVRVRIGDSDTVQVVARQKFRTNDEEKADKILEHLDLTMEKTSEGVELEAKYDGPKRLFNLGSTPVQVSFDVTVPANYHADLSTSGGDIKVGDLGGQLMARTSGGDIDVARISGGADAHTSGGDIQLIGSTGDVKLRTSGGDIEVDKVGGAAVLSTSGGDIEIREVVGAIRAKTSGGDVKALIKGPLAEDCKLSTSGGDVSVTVEEQIGFYLDASTSGGEVDAEGVTIRISRGGLRKHRLAGEVNGGGPVLELRTSGGDIDVVTR